MLKEGEREVHLKPYRIFKILSGCRNIWERVSDQLDDCIMPETSTPYSTLQGRFREFGHSTNRAIRGIMGPLASPFGGHTTFFCHNRHDLGKKLSDEEKG